VGFHDSVCYFLLDGTARSISLPDALLYINVLQDMLCLGFGIFKIIAVSIGGFLMPTAVVLVLPADRYRYRCLDCIEIG
jgi:hypothetical protein